MQSVNYYETGRILLAKQEMIVWILALALIVVLFIFGLACGYTRTGAGDHHNNVN